MSKIRALTMRQPWAWLVASGIKRIENRSWNLRGWIAIHAGAGFDAHEIDGVLRLLSPVEQLRFEAALAAGLPRSGIVAVAHVERCIVTAEDAPAGQAQWFRGPIGAVLDEVIQTPLLPCAGALSLWVPPPAVVEHLFGDIGEPRGRVEVVPLVAARAGPSDNRRR
jgi:hypothetical protein